MSQVVPLQELAEYSFRIDLDRIACDIRIYWTEFPDLIKDDMPTDGFWSMDISNSIFTINGIKLLVNAELMWPYAYNFGGFFLFDMSGANEDPEFIGMGDRWQLNYYPINEVGELRQALKLETI